MINKTIHSNFFKSFVLLVFLNSESWAYDPVVHENMSIQSVESEYSILYDLDWLKSHIGFQYPVDFNSPPFLPVSTLLDDPSDKYTVSSVIAQGSFDEDHGKKGLNHFYDPINERELNLPGINQIADIFGKDNAMSPDWILEDRGDFDIGTDNAAGSQEYSYKDARKYYYQALTTVDINERKAMWGKTFLTLGHVIHHIQDMAQPQHVRNDAQMWEEYEINYKKIFNYFTVYL